MNLLSAAATIPLSTNESRQILSISAATRSLTTVFVDIQHRIVHLRTLGTEDKIQGSPTYNKTTATTATAIDDNDGERTFFHYCYDCYCCRSRRNEWRHPWRHHGGKRERERERETDPTYAKQR